MTVTNIIGIIAMVIVGLIVLFAVGMFLYYLFVVKLFKKIEKMWEDMDDGK